MTYGCVETTQVCQHLSQLQCLHRGGLSAQVFLNGEEEGLGIRCIVILDLVSGDVCRHSMEYELILTSSHQSRVEVMGAQYPSLSGGYGIDGNHIGALAAAVPNEESMISERRVQ